MELRVSRPPSRFPLVCGALGGYDPQTVGAVAGALDPGMAVVHRDAASVLVTDRPPLSWGEGRRRGLAWSEGVIRPGRVACWQDAACRWGACGLVVDGDHRYLHTSVAGVAPVYYLRDGDAVYFASRLDALVQGTRSALSVDWDAWAAIFYLGWPLGDRTPFADVRRLEPFSTLEVGAGDAARVRVLGWPWAEVEPKLTVSEGVEPVVESARSAVRAVAGDRVLAPLSGGWDSRLLLCLLQEERPTRVAGAYTVRLENHEQQLAGPVASALGVPHTVIPRAPEDRFPSDFADSARRMDYQWVPRGFLVPLAHRLRSETGVLIDGLAMGALFQTAEAFKRPFNREQMFRPGVDVAGRLWQKYGRVGKKETVITRPLAKAMASSARRQLQAAADLWQGHPAQAALTVYRARQMRGISLTPVGIFGHDLAIAMPGVDHQLATALLSVAPTEKLHGRLYKATFARVNPTVGALPSTHDRRALPPRLPGPLQSPPVRRLLARGALRGPLRRYLLPEAIQALTTGRDHPGLQRGNHFLAAMTLFTHWHQRYRARLGDIDPPPVD